MRKSILSSLSTLNILANCSDSDATIFYAGLCNRQPVCTINPNMALKQHESNAIKDSLVDEQRTKGLASLCAKTSLYLEYTCVPQILLKPLITRSVPSKIDRRTKKIIHSTEPTWLNPLIESGHMMSLHSPAQDEPQRLSDQTIIVAIDKPISETPAIVTLEKSTDRVPSSVSSTSSTSDKNHVFLLSIVPSIACLLLLITLISYISHQKHVARSNAKRRRTEPQRQSIKSIHSHYTPVETSCPRWFSRDEGKTFDLTQTHLVPVAERSPIPVGCSQRLQTNELPHHWNPLAQQSPSLNSSCCKCKSSITYTTPICTLLAPQDHSIACCSGCPSSVIEGPKFNRSDVDAETQINLINSQVSSYPFISIASPQQLRRENEMIQSCQFGIASAGTQVHFDPVVTTSSSWSPSQSMTPSSNLTSSKNPWSVDAKCEIYGAYIKPCIQYKSEPENIVASMSPSRSTTTSVSTYLSPPLFSGSEMLYSDLFKPSHSLKYGHSRIPVVRYPHEFATDTEEEQETSQFEQTRESSHSDYRRERISKTLSNARPDLLCPSLVEEQEFLQSQLDAITANMNTDTHCSTVTCSDEMLPSGARFIFDPRGIDQHQSYPTHFINWRGDEKLNTISTASPRITPRNAMATMGTSNSSSNGCGGGNGDINVSSSSSSSPPLPPSKSNKTLRFQTPRPVAEVGFSTRYNGNNCIAVPTDDMSSSMWRSTQP